MWETTINGVDLYHLINWFFIYSFLGWLWETCYVSAKRGELINRGFVNGPVCTIYGFGALGVYLILNPVSGNLAYLFFGGIIVATLLEYATAVLMESIFHTSWWDYSDKKFNFQGRICLGASLGWGFFTVLLFRVLHPVVEGIVALYPRIVGEIGVCIVSITYAVDFCFSAAAAFHLQEKIPMLEQSLEQAKDELLIRMHEKLNTVETSKGMAIDALKERLGDAELLREIEAKRAVFTKELTEELGARKKAMAAKLGHNTRRFVAAYPNLNRGYKLRMKKRNERKHTEK